MIIDLTRLINGFVSKIEFDQVVTFDDDAISNTEIMELCDVRVIGNINKIDNDYNIHMAIKGKMVLPCAVSLKPVDYKFDIEVNETFSDNSDENENYFRLRGNKLDISSIIWQNIVMEIPFKVVSDDVKREELKGESWKLIEEREDNNGSSV